MSALFNIGTSLFLAVSSFLPSLSSLGWFSENLHLLIDKRTVQTISCGSAFPAANPSCYLHHSTASAADSINVLVFPSRQWRLNKPWLVYRTMLTTTRYIYSKSPVYDGVYKKYKQFKVVNILIARQKTRRFPAGSSLIHCRIRDYNGHRYDGTRTEYHLRSYSTNPVHQMTHVQ